MESWVLHTDLEVECPRCEYPIWVRGIEIVAQVVVTCPCCRARVRTIDADGSFQNGDRDIERQIEQALEKLWR